MQVSSKTISVLEELRRSDGVKESVNASTLMIIKIPDECLAIFWSST